MAWSTIEFVCVRDREGIVRKPEKGIRAERQ